MLPSLGIETWKTETLTNLISGILCISPKPLVIIDGKGGSGKTSLAAKLRESLDADLVCTDDLCWNADPIYWDCEMLENIIYPWLDGKNIAYRPSGWVKKGRSGFITVDPDKALIIEGSGACRKTLRGVASYSVWVDTEPDLSRMRVIHRDLANGENGGTLQSVTEFTDWWDSVVDPFLIEEKAWEYVDIIVSGSKSDLIADKLLIYVPDKLSW
jgi:uridine kinase